MMPCLHRDEQNRLEMAKKRDKRGVKKVSPISVKPLPLTHTVTFINHRRRAKGLHMAKPGI